MGACVCGGGGGHGRTAGSECDCECSVVNVEWERGWGWVRVRGQRRGRAHSREVLGQSTTTSRLHGQPLVHIDLQCYAQHNPTDQCAPWAHHAAGLLIIALERGPQGGQLDCHMSMWRSGGCLFLAPVLNCCCVLTEPAGKRVMMGMMICLCGHCTVTYRLHAPTLRSSVVDYTCVASCKAAAKHCCRLHKGSLQRRVRACSL
jgi:hypothetical protein